MNYLKGLYAILLTIILYVILWILDFVGYSYVYRFGKYFKNKQQLCLFKMFLIMSIFIEIDRKFCNYSIYVKSQFHL